MTRNNLAGIKILHKYNTDIIDFAIDELGTTAIHHVVKERQLPAMHFLLNNGVNVNVRGGLWLNTPLHEAVMNKDWHMARELFQHGADEKMTNRDGKTPLDFVQNGQERRMFVKAKQRGVQQRESARTEQDSANEAMRVVDGYIRRVQRVLPCDTNVYYTVPELVNRICFEFYFECFDHKRREIRAREIHLTSFGDECGVEVDQIAMTLYDGSAHLENMWSKIAAGDREVTKRTKMYKLLYALTVVTKRKKAPWSGKPPVEQIKKLTTMVYKKLPKKRAKRVLSKEYFLEHLSGILLALHDELVQKEGRCSRSSVHCVHCSYGGRKLETRFQEPEQAVCRWWRTSAEL